MNQLSAARRASLAFTLLAAALLAACASGNKAAPVPAAPTPLEAPPSGRVSIYSPAVSLAPAAPLATGKLAVDGLRWLNYRRAQLGLSALEQNAALAQISASHAAYLATHQSYQTHGHRQSPGMAGFTGVDPFVRMANAGFSTNPRSENMTLSRFNEGADKIDALIDAPYHRITQLGAFAQAGAGSSFVAGAHTRLDSYYFVASFAGAATGWGPAANQVVVLPAPGERQAPTSWRVLETPNPLPEFTGQVVGYPLSILAEPDSKLVVTAFTLSDERGALVNGRLVANWVDSGQSLGNYAFWIPLAPLTAGTRYSAHASGGLDGAPLDLRWSFTTAPFKALAIKASASQLPAAAGSALAVAISGGTGLETSLMGGHSRYAYFGGTDPKPEFASLEIHSATTATLKRSATPCEPQRVIDCAYVVIGTDSTGAQISLRLPVN